jgi:hypothetical protein
MKDGVYCFVRPLATTAETVGSALEAARAHTIAAIPNADGLIEVFEQPNGEFKCIFIRDGKVASRHTSLSHAVASTLLTAWLDAAPPAGGMQ